MAAATAPAPAAAPAPHRFTVAEYYRMAEVGILGEDDRVELLGGQIVDMSPIGPGHAYTVDRCGEAFAGLLIARRVILRTQNPLGLGEYDAPQPDVAVVRPRPDRYANEHPGAADVWLVIEVADSSVAADRSTKLTLYALAGIREAWLVNLPERRLEVYREPRADGYALSRPYRAGERVAPLAIPELELAVADLLPPSAMKRDPDLGR